MPEAGSVIAREGGRLSSRQTAHAGGGLEEEDYRYLRARTLADPQRYPFRILIDTEGEHLAIGSFVGILPLPSGRFLEILPKCFVGPDAVNRSRRALLRMVARSGPLPLRALDEAGEAPVPLPLHRALVLSFLSEVEVLLRQGLLSSYRGLEEERAFLHGRLNLGRQLRSRDLIPLTFWTVADEYREDRPENRLLRSALLVLAAYARGVAPDRYARVGEFFEAIDASTDIPRDFRSWGRDRLAARYRALEPWCRLILGDGSAPIHGDQRAPALLFPMARLFESYVGGCIEEFLPPSFRLVAQSRRHYLALQARVPRFLLRPDFLIRCGGKDVAIVDAKWKIVEESDFMVEDAAEVGPSQTDLYQLYAYGRAYLGGSGPMALAYPRTANFCKPSSPLVYNFDPELRLVMIPIDLDRKPESLLSFLRESLAALETMN